MPNQGDSSHALRRFVCMLYINVSLLYDWGQWHSGVEALDFDRAMESEACLHSIHVSVV